jgi:hypothetical protein
VIWEYREAREGHGDREEELLSRDDQRRVEEAQTN